MTHFLLEKNKLIFQYRFQQGMSIEDALIRITGYISHSLNDGKKKTFDIG